MPALRARLALALVLALTLAATAACGVSAGPREPYTHTFESSRAAVGAFLDALAARDAARLAALAVTEVEFRKNIWPSLPASRPEVGMPLEYLWAETSAKSRGYMADLVAEHGGRRYRLEAVTFGGEPTDYGTFRIHPETRLTVLAEGGRRETLRLFGSMLEADGAWKIFSYVVD